MAHEMTLKDAMIAAFEHLKSQDALLSVVITDVAALREALFEKNAETLVRYEEILATMAAEMTQRIAASAQVFGAIIQVLKDGGAWTN